MKNFTNNFKQFTSRLSARWLIMALMMLVGTSSAWAFDGLGVFYFDKTATSWTTPYLWLGHDSHSDGSYAMTRVSGTQYLYYYEFKSKSWDNAKNIAFRNSSWGGEGNTICHRSSYVGDGDMTHIYGSSTGDVKENFIYTPTSTQSNNNCGGKKAYEWGSCYNKADYKVTISAATGGTLTVKDYDNTTVSSGTSKIVLTVLKFSASASTGYTLKEVRINNGSTTTTISAANLGSTTYTLKSNVTITPVWTAKTYNITYKDQGDEAFSGTHASGYPTTHTYGTATTLKTASKDGYDFLGWFTSSDCSGTPVESLGATAYTANITLYAKWKQSCITADFSVNTLSDLAVGCTATASIGGNDRPTVTWTSSNTEVATIDASGNIKALKSGETTITATTTDANGFCSGTKQTTTLTVKNPSVTVEANKTSLCVGEELTLTATVTNAGTGNTYQWYKGDNSISGAESATYTINSVSADDAATYKVAVSGGILCQAKESAGVTVTVNALPYAPGLKTASSITVCPGDLSLANYVNVASGTTVLWFTDEDCTQFATSPNIAAGETKVFYAKAKNTSTGCLSAGKTTLTITAYSAPKAFTVTASQSAICAGTAVTLNIEERQTGVTYKLGNEVIGEDGITVTPTETTSTYKVVASLDKCNNVTTESSVGITVNQIPSLTNVGNVTLCSSSTPISVAELIAETKATASNSATIKLYDGNGVEITDPIDINVNTQTTTTYKLKASTQTCSSDFVSFTLTVNPIPTAPNFGDNNSETVCQGTTVTLPTELNSVKLKWYENENRTSSITSFKADAAKTVYAAAYNGICESAELSEYTYHIYPVPKITVSPRTQSALCHELVTVTATVTNRIDGALVYWYEGSTQVGTGDQYTFTKTTATTVSNLRAEIRNSVNCAPATATVPSIKFTKHDVCPPSYVQGKILYLVPGNKFGNNESWTDGGAWFAAAFLKTVNGTQYSFWVTMLDEDGDGTFACEIPTGYGKVVICRMNPDNKAVMFQDVPNNGHANWNYKWNETGEINVPTTPKKITITGWGSYSNTDLDSGKTFKTIVLNTNGIWNKDGATFKAHPWVDGGADGGWPRMIKGINDGIYLVDVYTSYNRILFERCDPSGSRWNVTADLDLDIYGNEFKIEEAGGHGNWHWKWYESDYVLGVQTDVVRQNGDILEIYCTGVVYKTSCAPGIKYGFEYATNEEMNNATYVEYAQGKIDPGKTFEKYIGVNAGEYYVRAVAQYEDGTKYFGWSKKVVIANNCDPEYEFTVGGTSHVVQACGGNRVLPAVEILTDKTPEGKTITWGYEWTNEDGSAATNLSATNIASPTFNGTASQGYKLRVYKKLGNDIKCTQSTTYEVAYEDNSPKAAITAKQEVQVNDALVLQGTINNSEGFTWLVKEGDTDVTDRMLSDVNALNPTFNTQETGEYTVSLTAAANLSCDSHTVTTSITVLPPTEDCSSSDIEVKLEGSHNCFNTSGGALLYKKVGETWEFITKVNSGSTYTFNTEQIDLPLQIFFGAENGNHCETSIERKGYTEIQTLTTEDLGLLLTYTLTGDNQVSTPGITSGDNKSYTREFTVTKKSAPVGTSVSAPSVTSSAATVDGTSTTAMLSAYLETTGCSAISQYGFQYIKQEEKPTSSSGATTVPLRTAITIGKTFRTQITSLTEGVYWYRAFATNAAGKSGYTEWKSFTIITDGPYPTLDCNNNAIEILSTGYVKVTVKNIGNEPVLRGSYGLVITDKGAVLAYRPQQVPEIAANNGTEEFTTVLPIDINNYNITATLTYKGRTQTCNKKICVPQVGGTADTIRYTIDASAVTDKCMLVFPSVYEAIDHLKKSNAGDDRFVDIVGEGYILRQPVVMEVVYSRNPYTGNVRVTTTGGYESGDGHLIIPITNINNDGNDGNGTYKITPEGNIIDGYNPLIIRAANPNAMPALQHVAIRKSRSVTLRNLNIISSTVDKDNAIDIDNNNNSWVGNSIGKFKNAKVTISNCKIKSTGFTCVHVSAVDKVYFDNNEITADLVNEDVKNTNTRCWGSSVKFIRSTNIKFIRNNFMGTHATSVWLQGVEKALFMNNVLWNNNKIEEDIFAMFRIVQQSSPEKPKNIGIYYNTLYLADNSGNRENHPRFNFLTLNSNDASDKDDAIAHDGDFDTGSIEFMYNNCYSYDMQTPGRPIGPDSKNAGPFKGRKAWAGLCYNNFWSAKDGADFSFNGCDNNNVYNVNVSDNVCTTTASDPNSLVISGQGLNKGTKPSVDQSGNVGASGIALNNDAELYQDRTRDDVRPENTDPWTLGAYQQTESIATDSIVWQGEWSSEWDDRNNWIDAKTKKTLTCVNTLSANLKVIIPAPHSDNYPAPDERGIVNYPILPEFNVRDARFGSELVNAGQGILDTPAQFADSIGMEYGASLRGVENLGTTRYNEATTEFTAYRDKWILVGTVVKPFNDPDDPEQGTRNVKSRDYYIEKQTPHVYMREAYMDGNTAKWNKPFTSLDEFVETTRVMAINIPNQYGAGKLTSQAYYTYIDKQPTKVNDYKVDKNYNFNGRFVNESKLPEYTGLKEGVPVLLNNTYPANIDPKVLESTLQGTVAMYDYDGGTFSLTSDDVDYIKPQHGFVFTPAAEKTSLQITSAMLVNGETTSRAASAEMPIFSLNLFNANSINGEYSRVVVKLDELKDEGPAPLDIAKVFADNSTTPELYIVMYDNMYQRVHISGTETIIPLGIRLKQSMNVSFQKFKVEGFDKVILVDKVKGVEYDLLSTKEVITEELSAGDIEGRFFLNLSESEEDTEVGDDNVTTEIEEDYATKAINILVDSDNSVKVVTNGVELETIYVSDMAGRTINYEVSGCYTTIELPVAQGAYMIHVVGDTASRTEKVILK